MKPYRYVLVGCGGISGAWLKPLAEMPEAVCAGLVDINRDAAERRKQEFGLTDAVTGTHLASMLRKVKPALVFDCTVPEAHIKVARTAFAAGCHVLCEKPLADTMAHAATMLKAAAAADRVHAIIQNRRFDPHARRVQSLLHDGVIGRLHTVYSDFFIGAHFGGFRDRMLHVLLLDMAIHTFDAARLLTGCDPVAVLAHEWNPPGSWYDHHASASAQFEMTNSVVYGYRGSWCSEGLNTTWESAWRFIGDQGSMSWDGRDGVRIQQVSGTEGFIRPLADIEPPPVPAMTWQGHGGVIHDFLESLGSGKQPETVSTDNVKSLAMVHAAIKSAGSGRRVVIPPLA
ncbi:MAG: oxidoreductase [Lentisphaerae bacterium RIFOXYC12_FULL_60_16]|nr:MAG: oxidoreductase [Lentisphaerae bacterium RIFOXYC12_FULL_60_16]